MATTKPDETEVEVVEEGLPDIESWDDVKDVINDGIDKVRSSSVDEIKAGALKVGNRLFSAWKKLTDGD